MQARDLDTPNPTLGQVSNEVLRQQLDGLFAGNHNSSAGRIEKRLSAGSGSPSDTVREPDSSSRPFLEDDPPTRAEDDPPTSGEGGASISVMPWDTKPTSRASVVFIFLFLVLAGVGGAFAWLYYGDQATGLIRAWSKSTVPPEGFAELQQQLKSLAVDLAAVKQALEQQSAANRDQLTRIQEQIAQQSIALQVTKQELSQKLSSPPPDKPVQKPLPKPAQHPAQVSTQDSSKPIQVAPPQPLLPPKQ